VKTALEPQRQSFEGDAGVSLSQSLSDGDELLTLPEVEALVKLKRSAIYTKIKTDGFPDNIPLGGAGRLAQKRSDGVGRRESSPGTGFEKLARFATRAVEGISGR
jgi:predicted DNA-binding transcriptional regulator AlpA